MNTLWTLVALATWGTLMIGLLSKITNSHRRDFLQNQILDMNVRNLMALTKLPPLQEEISEPLRMLIQNSENHPEAQEIEPSDQLVGIIFEGSAYPPEFDEDYED